jgi:aspartate--ammonia ligase
VSFRVHDLEGLEVEVVQSLAKWKRMALNDYQIPPSFGVYTDMNAIRPDEILDNIHSIYVDQWDWERVITAEERNLDFLKKTVQKIFSILQRTEFFVYEHYHQYEPILPEELTFIHAEDALSRYPNLTPKERENKLAKEYGAIFIIGIGATLSDGKPHDGRAPDYDDWTTETTTGHRGLNGDLILWNPVLNAAFEISSMGIRVDEKAMLHQLKLANTEERRNLYFHKRLLQGDFPLTIGGGIGQSRICMQFLRKAHIGEVQAGLWPESMMEECRANNIFLL